MTLPHDNDLAYVTTPGVPHNREAEEAVVGSVLIAPEVLPMLRGVIASPDEFYIHRHRWLWDIFCGMDARKVAIDLLTVTEELEKIGKLGEIGGRGFLTGLVNQVPSTMNAEHYARIIHSHHVRRRMIVAANAIAAAAYDESIQIEDVASTSIEAVQQAANGLIGGRAQDATRIAAEYTEQVYANVGKDAPGIATGFFDLDILLGGGFQPDNFAIIAARPGQGKSGWLETVALHTSKTRWTGLFSLEMSNQEQIGRMLAQTTDIDSMRLRAGKLNDEEWGKLDDANAQIDGLKLWIDDTAPLSFVTLRAKAVQKRAQGKLDLCIVDYAGLMQGVGNSPYERATYLSNNLKSLARELHVPVLAAQQLSRKVEDRENNEPTLFDLRDSGSWEQDADIVLLLWNEGEDVPNTDLVPLKLRLAKHRNGPTGVVDVMRVTRTTRFVSAERMTRNNA